jgi:hypothetical protein
MSWSYTFFPPKELPLTHDTLSEQTVGTFTDADAVRDVIGAELPTVAWVPGEGEVLFRGSVTDAGDLYELTIMNHAEASEPTLIVSMRCSGRIDSAPFAQRLCDATGWIAFDDRAYLFQPLRPPMAGGGQG